MDRTSSHAAPSEILPMGAVLLSMVSITTGVIFARSLFPLIGATSTTSLRLSFAALMLAVSMRIWRIRLSMRKLGAALPYGLSLGLMNLCFYLAIERIPLGVGIALEFLGPLTLALLGSRHWNDLLWVVCAAMGLGLLLPLPSGNIITQTHMDPRGILFALGAGVCWAAYIVTGRKAGHICGSEAPTLGMIVGAAAVFPMAATRTATALFTPALLLPALILAALSSAIPYSLEMCALRRLSTRQFSILTSAEPAIGAIMGMTFLNEHLPLASWLGIAAIVIASLGSTLGGGRTPPPP
ncbi:EamA family protein [Acetobacter estunensis NRIC 0472]|uniref:EamA family transporter n=1 Tax=Acetobacter estunensis TaxID=104097 RepID=A0A967B9M9_9PROT|nr:EamA family transporter [Acetobacter estunensis]NHO54701.1 EamA family transporter [Acetobacter estunensis]GBQ21339.1 EamA family protein [Acetobacter estunensis NRIC 0472]